VKFFLIFSKIFENLFGKFSKFFGHILKVGDISPKFFNFFKIENVLKILEIFLNVQNFLGLF
jgi:hypothetical protein